MGDFLLCLDQPLANPADILNGLGGLVVDGLRKLAHVGV